MSNYVSQKQIDLFRDIRRNWHEEVFNLKKRPSREKIIMYIGFLYRMAGLCPPENVFIADSPKSASMIGIRLVSASKSWYAFKDVNLWEDIPDRVKDSIWQSIKDCGGGHNGDLIGDSNIMEAGRFLCDAVADSAIFDAVTKHMETVDEEFSKSVYNCINKYPLVRNDMIKNLFWKRVFEREMRCFNDGGHPSRRFYMARLDFSSRFGCGFLSSWLMSYEFMREITGRIDEVSDMMLNACKTGIMGVIPLGKSAIVILNPRRMEFNAAEEIHCADGSAVEFFDGTSYCLWKGIPVPDRWILEKDRLGLDDLISQKNIELRRILVEIAGYEKMLAKAKLVNSSKKGNELFVIPKVMNGKDLHLLRYSCPSTGRVYVKPVPDEFTGADEAQAWSFGWTLEQYLSLDAES